jgi:hypothetical protein
MGLIADVESRLRQPNRILVAGFLLVASWPTWQCEKTASADELSSGPWRRDAKVEGFLLIVREATAA